MTARDRVAGQVFGIVLFVALLASSAVPIGLSASRPASLSFEERVSAQAALEKVLYEHRIWPAENGSQKPPFDQTVPRTAIQAKVRDYLTKSQALEKYWKRGITPDQLQAELDRMALQTMDPKGLQALFEAVGNDPLLAAECIARPALVERLLRKWYAWDERFHEKARTAARDRSFSPETISTSGEDGSSAAWVYRKAHPGAHATSLGGADGGALEVLPEDKFESLLLDFKMAPNGVRITETPVGFLLERLVSSKGDEAEVAAVLVPKVGFDEWWEKVSTSEEDLRVVVAPAVQDDSGYTLPRAFNVSPVPDSWDTSMSYGSVHGRSNHCAVWTGTEMIVWGGIWDDYTTRVYTNSGGRYSPATDTWVPLPVTEKTPVGRCNASAVWTGTEMLVWGGYWKDASGVVHLENSGGRFNANSGAWSVLPVAGAPEARTSHTAIWTGKEMIVWGGCQGSEFPLASGGRFSPKTGKWKTTASKNAPVARERHCAVWTGTEMIVWGGYRWDGADHVENTGGRYDPKKNKWISTANDVSAPEARYSAAGVWTGTEMIVWGGYRPDGYEWGTTQSGGRYNPTSNTWRSTNQESAPWGVGMASGVWTGKEMLVWGGEANGGTMSTGGLYNPVSDSWAVFSWGRRDLPESRYLHSAVWTGKEMIVWGGYSIDSETGRMVGFLSSGARYAPAADSWVPIRFGGNVPQGTSDCSTLWTGTELIVWGGSSLGKTFNVGGAYSFATASWRGLASVGAPAGRSGQGTVWTGTEVLVWGGWSGGSQGIFNDGGRYNPAADSWSPIPVSPEAPSGRYLGTAVWMGKEMIIWGGTVSEEAGSRFNPITGIWTPVATVGAPSYRSGAFGGWNGHEVLIWGGTNGGHFTNDGALYDPSNDTWRPAAPSPGVLPSTAQFGLAWSGKDLFIWGRGSKWPHRRGMDLR